MSGVYNIRLNIGDLLQGIHIVVQILKNGRSFAQNTISTEDGIVFEQVEDDVVFGMTWSVDYPESCAFHCEFLTVL